MYNIKIRPATRDYLILLIQQGETAKATAIHNKIKSLEKLGPLVPGLQKTGSPTNQKVQKWKIQIMGDAGIANATIILLFRQKSKSIIGWEIL